MIILNNNNKIIKRPYIFEHWYFCEIMSIGNINLNYLSFVGDKNKFQIHI